MIIRTERVNGFSHLRSGGYLTPSEPKIEELKTKRNRIYAYLSKKRVPLNVKI